MSTHALTRMHPQQALLRSPLSDTHHRPPHRHLTPRLEQAADDEEKVTHEDLAQGTEDAFAEPVKVGVKLNPELLEPCYTPILQSGGEFDLKPSATSNEKKVSNSRRNSPRQQPVAAHTHPSISSLT